MNDNLLFGLILLFAGLIALIFNKVILKGWWKWINRAPIFDLMEKAKMQDLIIHRQKIIITFILLSSVYFILKGL